MNFHSATLSLWLILSATGFSFGQKPEIKFEKRTIKFEKVNEGEFVYLNFPFTNTGTVPVFLNDYKVNCECTEVQLPNQPILPGNQDTVFVRFDTKQKIGYQERKVLIRSNADETTLTFRGVVKASEATKKAYKEGKNK